MKEDGIGKSEKDVEFYLENWHAGEHFAKFGSPVGEISKYRLVTNIRPGLFGRNLLRTSVQLPAVVNSFIIVVRIQSNVVEHCSAGDCWLWACWSAVGRNDGPFCYSTQTVNILHFE